jgi:membrane fusion protein (multidrug efflux system)
MKRIVVPAGLCALVCLTSCVTKKEQEKEESAKYTVTSPLKVDTSFTKEYVAQIRSLKNIEIRAQEKGFLEKIYVDEGQYVHAGQVLFKIMPKLFEAELMKAKAETDAAEIEVLNTKSLVDKNVVSKNELAMAQAKLDGAKAQMALANIHLSFTEIRAPFDGFIDRLPKKLGSLIDEGELLTTLSDNNQIYAYFNVSEPEYLIYQTDVENRGSNEVNLRLANGDTLAYKGNIEVIESEFDSETGNIAFRAKFPNSNRLLKNGETGKILMTIPLKNSLIIPQKSTYEIQDKKFVFVLDKNNVVHSRMITIKGEMPDLFVVDSGLEEGDKILLDGVQKVKDDDKIEYEFKKPEDVMHSLRLKAE